MNWLNRLNYHRSPRKFHEKKIRRRKRMFLYEAEDQPNDDPKEMYRVQCFKLILDQAIQSMGK